MTLATLADAPVITLPGIVGRPLAVPSRGSTELAIWALEVEPGVAGQPHTVSREEVFVLRAGALSATVGGTAYDLRPGDALIVPPDTEFALYNTDVETAHLTVCTSAGVQATLDGRTVTPAWSL